ncbi:amino acid/polyamine/organocation transporter, APC superfamily [Chitinophaga costaii]|uniref:Amino acid/polyamine/organocation transporter, APC superfamily n=1 Tax=Chitinophaga costaii TaxID=1335309 RepID=A0A1C3ZSQ2_9BACT|nr:amino acid permease [Chitinophaga costaii]PUZ30485.1 amino acid permease [Chitinophaga costaii]SCB85345.1 amino acid/polyamine/organocation transporter, APC superfamily [Chitinophaga costaii]
MGKLFVRKPLSLLLSEADNSEKGLKRTLSAGSLIALGIGAIIGAGLFVRTATAAGQHAGSAVTISFIIAAVGCAFAGLCYAEFASMIPIAGSAYTYSYATLGELVAWIIGWDLVLEYALGAATVAISWSEYLNKLCVSLFNFSIPYQWCHSPLQSSADGVSGIINLPAVLILFLLSMLLIRGIQQSAVVNAIIVIVKVAIVILFICLGWKFINPANHTPYLIPADAGTISMGGDKLLDYGKFWNHGWGGVVSGAGVVFFAFIGFDAVSTAAQETKNPKKAMPIGILVSLVICTVLYILFSHVMTGVAPYKDFVTAGSEASVAYTIDTYMPGYHWLSLFVTIAILAGFSSVILVMLLGQTRVFFSMAKDGLVPPVFAKLHPKFRTPYKSQWLFFAFVSVFAAFLPESIVGDMTSIGTLFAFILVCIGIIVMRKRNPEIPRAFKTPWVPLVPILGAFVCLLMVVGLGLPNWLRLIGWLIIGFFIYFGYSVKHSKARKL